MFMSGQTFFKQKIFFKRPQPFSPEIPKRMKRGQIQKNEGMEQTDCKTKRTERQIEQLRNKKTK